MAASHLHLFHRRVRLIDRLLVCLRFRLARLLNRDRLFHPRVHLGLRSPSRLQTSRQFRLRLLASPRLPRFPPPRGAATAAAAADLLLVLFRLLGHLLRRLYLGKIFFRRLRHHLLLSDELLDLVWVTNGAKETVEEKRVHGMKRYETV